MILVDLKGSLKHLCLEGELYNDGQSDSNMMDDILWAEEKIEVQSQPVVPKNEFLQDLDKNTNGKLKF